MGYELSVNFGVYIYVYESTSEEKTIGMLSVFFNIFFFSKVSLNYETKTCQVLTLYFYLLSKLNHQIESKSLFFTTLTFIFPLSQLSVSLPRQKMRKYLQTKKDINKDICLC